MDRGIFELAEIAHVAALAATCRDPVEAIDFRAEVAERLGVLAWWIEAEGWIPEPLAGLGID